MLSLLQQEGQPALIEPAVVSVATCLAVKVQHVVRMFAYVLQEQYTSLTNKTLAFFQLVTLLYDPQYIVKADDDVYLRVDRIPLAVRQWTALQSGELLCLYAQQPAGCSLMQNQAATAKQVSVGFLTDIDSLQQHGAHRCCFVTDCVGCIKLQMKHHLLLQII